MAGGVLADRVGRRTTLFVAQVSAATATCALAFAHRPALIIVLAVALGFSQNAARPAFSAMIADLVPAPDRVRAYALNYWAVNLGFAIAPVVAGVLADTSYVALFLGDGLSTLAVALAITLRVPETRPATAALTGPSGAPGVGVVLRDRVFMTFVGLSFVLAVVFLQHQVALPVTMRQDGIPATTYGAVLAVNGILIVLLQLPATRLLERWRRSRALALGGVFTAIGFGATTWAHLPWWYAATVAVWTLGEICISPVSTAVVADLAPTDLRGRYQGVFTVSWSLAAFVAPGLGGLVLEHGGRGALWGGCAVVALLVGVGHLVAGPARGRRLATLAAPSGPPAVAPESLQPS